MKFGPAEMAQMMDGAKALITVMLVSSVGIGLVLGVIVALYRIFFRNPGGDPENGPDYMQQWTGTEWVYLDRAYFHGHRAADQSFRSGMPTVPALPTVPVQEIDATAPHSLRSPGR
jgi:hypothetical protein